MITYTSCFDNKSKYEKGITYTLKDSAFKKGYLTVEYPFDTFLYRPPNYESVFYEADIGDDQFYKYRLISTSALTFRSCFLTLKEELSFKGLIYTAYEWLYDKYQGKKFKKHQYAFSDTSFSETVTENDYSLSQHTGHCSTALSHGDKSVSVTTDVDSLAVVQGELSGALAKGNRSVACATGERCIACTEGGGCVAIVTNKDSTATVDKNDSVALASSVADDSCVEVLGSNSLGVNWTDKGRAKGIVGSYLLLRDGANAKLIYIGKGKYKPDTWYHLEGNKVYTEDGKEVG